MNLLRRLFQREMHALQEEGPQFAKDYPEAARFLDQSKVEDRDPYVERIIESTAFQMGQIREVMSDSPEDLDKATLEQFIPDFLQPLPSVSVVQFFTTELPEDSVTVPVGAVVRSKSVNQAPNGIPFRLLHPVEITPGLVQFAKLMSNEDGSGKLELELIWNSRRGSKPWIDSLRFFLFGDAPIVWALRHMLTRLVTHTELKRAGQSIPCSVSFKSPEFPCYTTENDLATPMTIARDFLCCDERFRFLDLTGLGSLHASTAHPLHLTFHIKGPMARGLERGVKASTFRLHCGVVVNRSLEALRGITWDHTKSEVLIQPVGGSHREVLEVKSVRGFDVAPPHGQSEYRHYASHAWNNETGIYHITHETTKNGQFLTRIGLAEPNPSRDLKEQRVGVEAVCGDSNLPHQRVPARSISVARKGVPGGVGAVGLVRPSPSYRMGTGTYIRSLLFCLSYGHFNGWFEAEQLKDGLRHAMWDTAESKRTMIEAIQEVSVENGYTFDKGVYFRQMVVAVRLRDTTCTPNTWDRLGILDAFGSVLLHFVRDRTEIGSKYLLRLCIDPAGAVMEFGGHS